MGSVFPGASRAPDLVLARGGLGVSLGEAGGGALV